MKDIASVDPRSRHRAQRSDRTPLVLLLIAILPAACASGDVLSEAYVASEVTELGELEQRVVEPIEAVEFPNGPPRVRCPECRDLIFTHEEDGVYLNAPAGFALHELTLERAAAGIVDVHAESLVLDRPMSNDGRRRLVLPALDDARDDIVVQFRGRPAGGGPVRGYRSIVEGPTELWPPPIDL